MLVEVVLERRRRSWGRVLAGRQLAEAFDVDGDGGQDVLEVGFGLSKLDKIGWDGVRGELTEAGIPQQACETALDMIAALPGTSPSGTGRAHRPRPAERPLAVGRG